MLEKFRLAFIGTISLIVAFLISLPFKELLNEAINDAIINTGEATASVLELLKVVTNLWFDGILGVVIAIILLIINIFVSKDE
jgi:ABC-type bacteriocin/lantibiotic exporter with double-glycine peptidase domain